MIKKLFSINFKNEKLSVALILWLFSFLLHNFLSGINNLLSIFFFIITFFIIPAYFIIALIYSLINSKSKK